MEEPRAHRTLVKSPPELWAEISDHDALAAHLGAFGEIRITRTEPETTVAWEGDRARGTVELEPSGWGTKVTLTADVAAAPEPVAAAQAPPEVEPEPEPEVVPEPPPAPRRGFLARLFGRRTAAAEQTASPPVATVEMPAVQPEPEPEPAPAPLGPDRAEEILCAVLDDLGSAHHRPFSR